MGDDFTPLRVAPSTHGSQRFPLKAYLAITTATLLWSTNLVAVKLAVREIPPLALTSLRVTLAAVTLAAVYAASGGRFDLRPGEGGRLLKLSLAGLALSFLCLTTGLHYTSVSHAVFISALIPMAVLLIARAQRLETITPAKLAGLLLSLGGVLALVSDQAGGRSAGWKGDLLILISACSFAFFTVKSKQIAAAHHNLEFTAFAFLAAALGLAPLLVVEIVRVHWSAITWAGWTSLLYSAVFGSACAYLTYNYSLRLLPPSRVAAFHYLQPALATGFGMLIFHDRFTVRFALGAALILTGLGIARERWAANP